MQKNLRIVGWLEGISLLLLLFIAMPLKYVYGIPVAVRIAGSIHGLLFIGFVTMLYQYSTEKKWSGKRLMVGLFCAVVPFGPFWFDAKYLK